MFNTLLEGENATPRRSGSKGMEVGEKQRRHGRLIDVYFQPIFRLHNTHGIDSVGCRTTPSGDARRNTSRYRVNKSADGVLRDGSPFSVNHFPKLFVRTRLGQSLQTACSICERSGEYAGHGSICTPRRARWEMRAVCGRTLFC